ncbi:hypothetical protein BB561_001780 [Smittium simulii]|uniref:Aspartic peptidase DDI1-type domain-containing protein n=1 Tax=Smittium simulii TaxID=133385 RepID=A0A2T9YT79_9FUNG|nr:hypothetical protein BB561_001780 [Smittium simulii]
MDFELFDGKSKLLQELIGSDTEELEILETDLLKNTPVKKSLIDEYQNIDMKQLKDEVQDLCEGFSSLKEHLGHATADCYKMKRQQANTENVDSAIEKTSLDQTKTSGFLAIEEKDTELLALNFQPEKRMRIKEIINKDYQNLATRKVVATSDNNVPPIKKIQKKQKDEEDDQKEEVADSLSFILTQIKGQDVPIYLDTGARFSIMDKDFLEAMGLPTENLKEKTIVRPVSGPPIDISEYVTCNVEFETEKGNVAVLIRLDAIQELKATIDYEKKTVTLVGIEEIVEVNLISRASLILQEK